MLFTKLAVFLVLSLTTRTSLSHKQHLGRNVENDVVRRQSGSRCGTGTYSSNGYSPCTSCAPGTYSKEQGQTRCLQARAGYYVAKAGQSTETPCAAGTYNNNPGSTGCLSCPPGFMCPSNAMSVPQQCSPGRYSKGGEKECPRCPAGYFNNIHKATECCACPAGWFNANAGNTNCQMCPNQTPYSDPGTTTMNKCSSKPGIWAPSKTSQQTNGNCPPSHPIPSAHPKRHVKPKPKCQPSEKACPIYSGLQLTGYGCVDVQSNLESCGGCLSYSFDGRPSADGGRDCSTIPYANEVACIRGKCDVGSCQPGYVVSVDRSSCVLAFKF